MTTILPLHQTPLIICDRSRARRFRNRSQLEMIRNAPVPAGDRLAHQVHHSCLFTTRPPGRTSKKITVHNSPMLSGHPFLIKLGLHPFQLDRKDSFSNAALPALGWLFFPGLDGQRIQASTHKISTHAYSFAISPCEIDSISVTAINAHPNARCH